MEIFKEVGLPPNVAERFGLATMSGTHAIGHTRMATESAVTTDGAHPYSTGKDQCLVHNGSLSNHNNLRRELKREGLEFETENDTEVAAGYLTWRMREGLSLGDALKVSLDDLDGFYTFVVGTENGFGVLRDGIACKPAVMAETDQYVAFGSEYRALAGLPGIEPGARLGARTRHRLFLGTLNAGYRPQRHAAQGAQRGAAPPDAGNQRTPLGRSSTRPAVTLSPRASMSRSPSRSTAPWAITAPA